VHGIWKKQVVRGLSHASWCRKKRGRKAADVLKKNAVWRQGKKRARYDQIHRPRGEGRGRGYIGFQGGGRHEPDREIRSPVRGTNWGTRKKKIKKKKKRPF